MEHFLEMLTELSLSYESAIKLSAYETKETPITLLSNVE